MKPFSLLCIVFALFRGTAALAADSDLASVGATFVDEGLPASATATDTEMQADTDSERDSDFTTSTVSAVPLPTLDPVLREIRSNLKALVHGSLPAEVSIDTLFDVPLEDRKAVRERIAILETEIQNLLDSTHRVSERLVNLETESPAPKMPEGAFSSLAPPVAPSPPDAPSMPAVARTKGKWAPSRSPAWKDRYQKWADYDATLAAHERALSGTIAVTAGFALKDVATSFMAGLTILITKPFQVGDRVSFGGYYGEVKEIGLRTVRMVTLDDNLVTIPTNSFLTEPVASANAGQLDCMVVTKFYVPQDADHNRAREIVEDAVLASKFLFLGKPLDTLLATTLTQQGAVLVEIMAKAYVYDARQEKAFASDVTDRVLTKFREEGLIGIGSPQNSAG